MRRFVVLLALFAVLGIYAATADAGGRPTIYVWNNSNVIRDATLIDAIPVWQRAIDEDFAPEWNADAQLVFSGNGPDAEPPADHWYIEVTDRSDYWGALAYHGIMGPAPYARIFAADAIEFGFNWEVSFTHELWEMLADPYINRTIQVREGVFYYLEVADPVEADRYAYWRLSATGVPVAISDFVFEAWYRPHVPGPYDFAGHVKKPFQVLKGGYQAIFIDGRWTVVERFRPKPHRAE